MSNTAKPKKSAKVTRSIVFDRSLLNRGQAAAKADGRSFSNWVNETLRIVLGAGGVK